MLTIQFGKELTDTAVKINSAAPGYTITDMNQGKGTKSVEQASQIIIQLALLDENGPSGRYFEESVEIPW